MAMRDAVDVTAASKNCAETDLEKRTRGARLQVQLRQQELKMLFPYF